MTEILILVLKNITLFYYCQNIDKDYEQLNIDIGNNEIKIEAL